MRVFVTGVGVVTPIGTGKEKFWENLIMGKSGVARITKFDPENFRVKIAAEVKDFNPEDFVNRKDVGRYDLFILYGIAAAKMAIEDAGLETDKINRERVATVVGSGIGGIRTIEENKEKLLKRGPRVISPFFIPASIGNIAASKVAIEYGFKGPCYDVVTACATGADAIGLGFWLIKMGLADVAVVGGTEAAVTPLSVAGFGNMRALTASFNDDPEKASRPFDAKRDGFVVGEGAGILVLESEEHAKRRGARAYAELLGYGATCDAYHITAPDPEAEGAARAIRLALEQARIPLEEVDMVNAHGTSTPLNDKSETLALKKVFGEHAYNLAVTANKSMIGHTLGAAGAVESVATVLSIYHGVVPPTINYEEKDPDCDLDYVADGPREMKVRYAIKNSFGFGGHNSVLVFGGV